MVSNLCLWLNFDWWTMDSVFTKTRVKWRRAWEWSLSGCRRPGQTALFSGEGASAERQARSAPCNGHCVAVCAAAELGKWFSRQSWCWGEGMGNRASQNGRELTIHTEIQLFSWIYAYKLAASLWLISSIPTKLTWTVFASVLVAFVKGQIFRGPYYPIIPRILLCLTIILK